MGKKRKGTEAHRLHTNVANSSTNCDHIVINLLVSEPDIFPSLHSNQVKSVQNSILEYQCDRNPPLKKNLGLHTYHAIDHLTVSKHPVSSMHLHRISANHINHQKNNFNHGGFYPISHCQNVSLKNHPDADCIQANIWSVWSFSALWPQNANQCPIPYPIYEDKKIWIRYTNTLDGYGYICMRIRIWIYQYYPISFETLNLQNKSNFLYFLQWNSPGTRHGCMLTSIHSVPSFSKSRRS